MRIPDLMPNRYSYKPRGNAEKFQPYFEKLKDVMADRFNAHMKFSENTVIWDSEQSCVTVTFPVDASPALMELVSYYIFGAFGILGF